MIYAPMRIDQGASLVRTVAPSIQPLTVDELKAHRRIDWDDEDDVIQTLGEAATEAIENRLSRALMTQTWVLKLDRFPSWDEITLPRPPLQSVTTVQYVDTAGATQTLSSSVYVVDTATDPGRLYLKPEEDWPSTKEQELAITVTYKAGYTEPSAVPAAIRMVIHALVGDLYENREASAEVKLEENRQYRAFLAEHQLYLRYEW